MKIKTDTLLIGWLGEKVTIGYTVVLTLTVCLKLHNTQETGCVVDCMALVDWKTINGVV